MNTTQTPGNIDPERSYWAQIKSTEDLQNIIEEGFDIARYARFTLAYVEYMYKLALEELAWRNQFAGRRYINS